LNIEAFKLADHADHSVALKQESEGPERDALRPSIVVQ